jgi:medium-chain acyl-[acyl-carrier-protein] hydrolase
MDGTALAATAHECAADRWCDPSSVRANARVRLFCFPHAGGGAATFRDWARLLPEAIAVVPVHLPGRAQRLQEPPFRALEPLVRSVAGALRPHVDRPFALFGHSVGALIAFELARVLEREYGRTAEHLIVAGRRAPDHPMTHTAAHTLPREEFIDLLLTFNGMPAELLNDEEALDLLIPILRADFEVSETYVHVPAPPVNCPITVLGGSRDPWVAPHELGGWARHTSGRCSVHPLEGDHFFIASARQHVLRVIADALRCGPATCRLGLYE